MRLLASEGVERIVTKLILEDAARHLGEEEQVRLKNMEIAVNNGVVRAFVAMFGSKSS